MSNLSLRLPDSLHEQVRQLAEQEGISMNQFISSAVAEKMSALMTKIYLERRAEQGREEAFWAALSNVPDVEPADEDRL